MKLILIFILFITYLSAAEAIIQNREIPKQYTTSQGLNRVGDYPYPTNPLDDRAKGYLLKGKAKTAVGNAGNLISWAYHPAGFWGEYGFLPHVGFVAGVPGHEYSSDYIS